MLSLYQRYFPFRTIMFTQSPLLISLCNKLSIQVVTKVERNQFGLPILRSMIQRSKHLFTADHYGYMNGDILFSPNLFDALTGIKLLVKGKTVSSTVGF